MQIIYLISLSLFFILILIGINALNINVLSSFNDIFVAIGVMGSIASILKLFNFHAKKYPKKSILRRQSVDQLNFINRKNEIQHIIEQICKLNVLNVYGDKGVGKSATLKIINDILNNTIDKKIKRKFPRKKEFKSLTSYFCLYYDISDMTGIEDIKNDICKKTFPELPSNFEAFIRNVQKVFKKNNLIIIFDNFNNPGLAFELGKTISHFHTFRPQDKFIIGSVEQIILYSQVVDEFEILPLKEKDIKTYADRKGRRLSETQLSNLIAISNGLPIYLEIVLNSGLPSLDFNILKLNIKTLIFNQIWKNLSDDAISLLKVSSFINLVHVEITENSLKEIGLRKTEASLALLKRYSLIIPLSSTGLLKFKVHDQIRDIIIEKYFEHSSSLNSKIASFYKKKNKNKEAVLHFIISNDLLPHLEYIYEVITDEIVKENLPFLLAVGQLFERFERSNFIINNTLKLYNLILYAYLYSTMGIGNYPQASSIIESVVIGEQGISGLKDIDSEIEFEFHFLMADLDHLKNKYSQSIEMYRQLANIAKLKEYSHLLPKCFFGMAHAYRHQGKYLSQSLHYYNVCLETAVGKSNDQYYIKALNGLICIHLLLNNFDFPFEEKFRHIYQFSAGKNKLEEILLSTMKYHSIYLRKIKNYTDAKYYIDKAFGGFERIGKRLIYNMHFEYAEYYRSIEDFAESFKHYVVAYEFSEKNNDRNLKTHSMLGIILCEIAAGKYFYHQTKNEQKLKLVEIQTIAEEADIHITKLQIQIIIEYLNEHGQQSKIGGFNSDFAKYLEHLGLRQELTIYKILSIESLKTMQLILL